MLSTLKIEIADTEFAPRTIVVAWGGGGGGVGKLKENRNWVMGPQNMTAIKGPLEGSTLGVEANSEQAEKR